MAFTEALRLVVDADTRGAVAGIEKLGNTAEKEFARSQNALDKWGNRLTTVGAGMVAFGGAALVGLGSLAKQSEEAQLATLKLENTIQNMPKLAGATADEFIDLADSIQKVTAADADAIVEGQALLGTFNLTAKEIKGITPLVVDYARKFGIDIPDAAIQVGKALDGQVGALKRNGVSIDEVLFKTDRYRAVSEALSNQVGGFAEQEGATFAGSLERMKNELGDLAEGVGGGAVDAFTDLFSVVERGANAMESISPGAQNVIGKFATFGAVALTAAGGLTFVVGQAIKAHQTLSTVASAVKSATTAFGGLKTAAGVGGAATAMVALAAAAELYNQQQQQQNIKRMTAEFLAAGDSVDAMTESMKTLTAQGPTELIGTFSQLAETNRVAAERFIETAEAAGASDRVISEMKDHLETMGAAEKQTAEDTDGLTTATDGATEAIDGAAEAVKSYSDQLNALFDPLFGAINAQHQLDDANTKVAAAELELAKAIQEHGENSIEAMVATDELRRAQVDAASAALGQQSAMSALQDAVADEIVSIADAKTKLQEWVNQGLITQASADETARKLDAVAAAAGRIPRNINIDVVTRESTIVAGSRNIPKRARGGPVSGNRVYEVVEEGEPELLQQGGRTYLLPSGSGQVMPLSAMGGAGGGGFGGGQPIDVHSHVYLDGREITHTVKRVVRNDHGGDVQAALGWSAA